MDDQTRFWIAQQVAGTKFTPNIRPLFAQAKEIAQKRPNTLITDGAPFMKYIRKNLHLTDYQQRAIISHIRFRGDHNNNKMERRNGEVRDCEKVMRGLKIQNTSVLPGCQIYHNYFRPHMALKGKTPAEKCGIVIE